MRRLFYAIALAATVAATAYVFATGMEEWATRYLAPYDPNPPAAAVARAAAQAVGSATGFFVIPALWRRARA